MTDTIASRVTRVIGGSVHALLDAVENAAPESAMSQAIREIDQALDEVLARAGIARQVDIEDQIPVLQRSLHDAMDRSRELEGYIAALAAKKREMESALADFVAARAAASAPAVGGAAAAGSATLNSATQAKAERAGSAFDRVLARETGIAGVTSPLDPNAAKLHELQELARTHRIDERLAAIKAGRAHRG
jgi:phage shock protein A